MAWAGKLAVIRARPRGQRLRRKVHSDAQVNPTLGPHLRHGGGAAPGLARLQTTLQYRMAHRATRLQAARRRPSRTAHANGVGCISAIGCLKTVDRNSLMMRDWIVS